MSEEVLLYIYEYGVKDSEVEDSVEEAAALAIYMIESNIAFPDSITQGGFVLWKRKMDNDLPVLESIVHFCKHGYTLKPDGWYKSGRYQFSLEGGVKH